MKNENAVEKMEVLMNNAECQQKLKDASTLKDIRNVFVQFGVQISLDDVKKMIKEEAGELSDNDLDDIAGGCHGFQHITGYRVAWVPVAIFRGKIINGPVLVPIYCKK